MIKPQDSDSLSHADRLLMIKPQRAPRFYIAEAAASGTNVPEDHKGGGFLIPALADIWAAGALAHRVQTFIAHELFEGEIILAMGQLHFEPGVVALGEHRSWSHRSPVDANRAYCRRCVPPQEVWTLTQPWL